MTKTRAFLLLVPLVVDSGCNSDPSTLEPLKTEATAAMDEHRLSLTLEQELDDRLREEASRLRMSREDRVKELLEYGVAPAANLESGFVPNRLNDLKDFIEKIPGVDVISTSEPDESHWWIQLSIDIHSKSAWHVVQNLGYVLNELSVTEKLPTTFKPVSPPPYLNGGPGGFLSWVIEAEIPFLDPSVIQAYLEQRLPSPVSDEEAWLNE